METAHRPREAYDERLHVRRAALAGLRRTDARLSWLRLSIFLVAAALVWPVVMTRELDWLWMLLPVAAFVVAARAHDRVIRRRTAARRAVAFYEAGLARIEGRWAGLGIQGREFLDREHPYADDLDLFGEGSLFELLCTARTRAGERTLAAWLLEAADPDEIRARHEAVRELRPALDLREELARLGEEVRDDDDPEALSAWASAPTPFASGWPAWVAALLATANVTSAGLWAFGLPRWPLVVSWLASGLFTLAHAGRVRKVLGGVVRPDNELQLLSGVLSRVERESFSSPKLRALRSALDVRGRPPSARIARLARLVELHDSRRNMIFAPISAMLLLGSQLAFAMERWRARSGSAVGRWIDAVGQFEALGSIASHAYENPDADFPEIVEDRACLEAEELGHPLLAATTRVANDIRLGRPVQLLLVSGSNMSGKSTLLRTIGINVVLAQAGAPVHARRLRLSPFAVGASLNVRDSLQEGTSHFYAEIKRLSRLLELGRGPRPLLFLLDEILHGTNSHDRRIGADALIRELMERGALGLVTTHDLALAEIAGALGPRAANVHFEDHVEQGRIAFDYRLRPGIVRKSNALELMRSVGLDV